MSYTPPEGDAIVASWVGTTSYAPPEGDAVYGAWADIQGYNIWHGEVNFDWSNAPEYAFPPADDVFLAWSSTFTIEVRAKSLKEPTPLELPFVRHAWRKLELISGILSTVVVGGIESVDAVAFIRAAGIPSHFTTETSDPLEPMLVRHVVPQWVSGVSLGPQTIWGWARAAFTCIVRPLGYVRLDYNWQFRPVVAGKLASLELGAASVRNYVMVASPVGLDSLRIPTHRTWPSSRPILFFNIMGPIRVPNARNIPFYWGFTRAYNPEGINSLVFGALAPRPGEVTASPSSIAPKAVFGQIIFELGPAPEVKPAGVDYSSFGNATMVPGAVSITLGPQEESLEFGEIVAEAIPIPELGPEGIAPAVVTPPYIWTWLQYAEFKTGPPFTQWGTNTRIRKPIFSPIQGFETSVFGSQWISFYERRVYPKTPVPYTQFGDWGSKLLTQFTRFPKTPALVFNSLVFGGTLISNEYRWLAHKSSNASLTFGTQLSITLRNRYYTFLTGTLPRTSWGNHRIAFSSQVLEARPPQPHTFGQITVMYGSTVGFAEFGPNVTTFGTQRISNGRQFAVFAADGYPRAPWTEWGVDTKVYNVRQYIGKNGIYWGGPTERFGDQSVVNRNLVVKLSGTDFGRIHPTGTQVYFGARKYSMAPGSSLQVFGATVVRPTPWYISPNGLAGEFGEHELTEIIHWSTTPGGIEATGYGEHYIGNWTQYIAPFDVPFTQWGNNRLFINNPIFVPRTGWQSSIVSTYLKIADALQRVTFTTGVPSPAFVTTTTVWNWRKSANELTCGSKTTIGALWISNKTRWLELGNIGPRNIFGNFRYEFADRKLDLQGKGILRIPVVGAWNIELADKTYAFQGFDAIQFGEHLIENAGSAYLEGGIDGLEFGQHSLRLTARAILFNKAQPIDYNLAFGWHKIYNLVQYVKFPDTVVPWNWITVGQQKIWNFFQVFRAPAIDSLRIPLTFHGIKLEARALVFEQGLDSARYGKALVQHERRDLTYNFFCSNCPFTKWGAAEVRHAVKQIIDLRPGLWDPRGGLPVISHRLRWIGFHEIGTNTFGAGRPRVYDPIQIIDFWSESEQHTQWGDLLSSRDNPVQMWTHRFSHAFGLATATFGNWIGFVGPDSDPSRDGLGINSLRMGAVDLKPTRFSQRVNQNIEISRLVFGAETRVFNSRQYVTANHYWAWVSGPWWGDPWLRNRNRVIRPTGFLNQSFPVFFQGIYNTGRAVTNVGASSFSYVGFRTEVTHRNRALVAEGKLHTLFSPWSTLVYNAARALTVAGLHGEVVSTKLRFEATRRWLKLFRPHAGPMVGTHFIAPAVRAVFLGNYVGNQTKVSVPYIGLLRRRVVLPGSIMWSPGNLEMRGPFKRGFSPQLPPALTFGLITVTNFFKEVTFRWGVIPPALGTAAWASHAPRYIKPGSLGPFAQISRFAWIRDRKQKVDFSFLGPLTWVCQKNTKVRLYPTPEPIPEKPHANFNGQENTGRAPEPTGHGWEKQCGVPHIQGTLRQMEGWDSSEVSQEIDLRSQAARIRNYYSSMAFGRILLNDTQIIEPTPKGADRDFAETLWGSVPNAHRVSPYTIWCRTDITQQATYNHPYYKNHPNQDGGGYWIPVKIKGEQRLPPIFGEFYVTSTIRYLNHYHNGGVYGSRCAPSSRFGDWQIELKTRKLELVGWRSALPGIPIFYPHKQKIRHLSDEHIGLEFYPFTVRNVDADPATNRRITILGKHYFVTGTTKIELKNRSFMLPGKEHTIWGNNTPMVHFPRGFIPGGFVATGWGNPWVSYLDREFLIEGTEPPEQEWTGFHDRMFVTYDSNAYYWVYQTIRRVTANQATRFGGPTVLGGRKTVNVYQIPACKMKPGGLKVENA